MVKFKYILNDGTSAPTATNAWVPDCEEQIGNRFVYAGFEIIQEETTFEGIGAIAQENIIKNTGDKDIRINRFSSTYIEGIAPAFYKNDVMIHYCNNCWEGEAQWVSQTPYEFGLYPVAKHTWSRTGRSIGTVGSWSTCKYYPILLIEDRTNNKTWYFEHEGGFSWAIELGTKGEIEQLGIVVEVNSFDENQSGFTYTLRAQDSYKTSRVVYGAVDGGVEEAICELLKYKRMTNKRFDKIPVCFNDYMNCLWARPTDEKLIPLIDRAAEVGAEVFCIDDGWFKTEENGYHFGDWVENDDKFGEYKFRGIIEYIKSKGMKPGVWFEMETCVPQSKIFSMCGDSVLMRDGKPVGNNRCFLNFNNQKIRDYLFGRIEYLYNMGVRFIKNDYNHTSGIGCDNSGHSYAYGLVENIKAFYSFIDEAMEKFPELIIENCGSGAMRCDNGTLKHFYLQSSSDQEMFNNNPSIVWGMQRCMLPEKTGIWSFPFPLESCEIPKGFDIYNDEYYQKMSDGERTIYNMACSMFGVMYLSGHIEMCDEYNKELIKEGIDIYKKDRDFLLNALPLFVYPQQELCSDGYSVLALGNGEKIRLGVFKFNADDGLKIDMSKWINIDSTLKQIYPVNKEGTAAALENAVFTFTSDKKIAARVYEIKM